MAILIKYFILRLYPPIEQFLDEVVLGAPGNKTPSRHFSVTILINNLFTSYALMFLILASREALIV